MSAYRIAVRYAKSLHDLAIEQNKLERVMEDVKSFRELIQDRDFALFVKSPVIPHQRKAELADKILKGKYDPLTMAFLRILFQKGREKYLAEIASEFIALYKKFKGISTVKLTTAAPLSEQVIKQLEAKLKSGGITSEQIEFHTKVDPDMIGGFILEVDDLVYDASLAHKLDALRREFAYNPYVSQILSR